MEGIFMGQVTDGVFSINKTVLTFNHECDIHELHPVIRYSDCDYMLVKADDVIKTNDELLKLRDEVKELTDECNDWKVRYSTVNNKLFQKGLAYGTLETTYKNEKIAGGILLKDRDALKERVEKLEAELTEIKTTHTLREAYITGVEKGCASLKEDRDTWKRRWNTVVTDIAKSLEANGIEFTLKEIHGDGNWDVVIDIPKLNEAKKKVEDLEKKLKAAKSNETFWRDRKEEEEEYHHYWLHTFDRVVKQAADKGIHIDVRGTDEDCNAGIVVVDNVKAEELEKQIKRLEDDNSAKAEAVINAKDRGDYYKGESDAMARNYRNLEKSQEKKWSAMTEALKAKGVEVIYMGEEDDKPLVDVKIPKLDALHRKADARAHQIDILRKDCIVLGQTIEDLKREIEALKSRTLDNVEIRLSCGDIVWTYCDGFVHVSSGIISADQITTGVIPKCSSCSHFMHNPSRFAHDWCYMTIPKEGGAGYIRRLNKEEAEGPACSDFKARKE